MKRDKSGAVVLGNVYDKYGSANPIARHLFRSFLNEIRRLIAGTRARTILEVGCGEGYLGRLISQWMPESSVVGADLSRDLFDPAVAASKRVRLVVQSAYGLGFRAGSFDLVVGAEVLEHLERPALALAEAGRVANRYLLFSVPREPIWRLMNLARLSYVADWGNTPGHLQHWSSRSFRQLIGRHFEVLEETRPLPWTIILARVREGTAGSGTAL